MIIALLNQKGGVGKTTLATHIAGELALRGQHVVLLDADPQGSSLDWTQRRAQQGLPRLFSAVGLARETLHQEAPELARRADHVIIDGPPRIAALARSALLAAERVVIPVQPSPYDLWASAEMVALIREAQVFRPQLAAAWYVTYLLALWDVDVRVLGLPLFPLALFVLWGVLIVSWVDNIVRPLVISSATPGIRKVMMLTMLSAGVSQTWNSMTSAAMPGVAARTRSAPASVAFVAAPLGGEKTSGTVRQQIAPAASESPETAAAPPAGWVKTTAISPGCATPSRVIPTRPGCVKSCA